MKELVSVVLTSTAREPGTRERDMPDVSDIPAVLDVPNLNEGMFDESAGYEDDTGIRLTKGLSEQERRQATQFTGSLMSYGDCVSFAETLELARIPS